MSSRRVKREYFRAFVFVSLGCFFLGASLVLPPFLYSYFSCSWSSEGTYRRTPVFGVVSNSSPVVETELFLWYSSSTLEIWDFLTNDIPVNLCLREGYDETIIETIYYTVNGTAERQSFSVVAYGRITFQVIMNSTPAFFSTWLYYYEPPPPMPPCMPLPVYMFMPPFGLVFFGVIFLIVGIQAGRRGEKHSIHEGTHHYRLATIFFALGFIFLGISAPVVFHMSTSFIQEEAQTDWGPFTVILTNTTASTNITLTNLAYSKLTLYRCFTNITPIQVRVYCANLSSSNPLVVDDVVYYQATFEAMVVDVAIVDVSSNFTSAWFSCWIYTTIEWTSNPYMEQNMIWAIPMITGAILFILIGMRESWVGSKQLSKWKV